MIGSGNTSQEVVVARENRQVVVVRIWISELKSEQKYFSLKVHGTATSPSQHPVPHSAMSSLSLYTPPTSISVGNRAKRHPYIKKTLFITLEEKYAICQGTYQQTETYLYFLSKNDTITTWYDNGFAHKRINKSTMFNTQLYKQARGLP